VVENILDGDDLTGDEFSRLLDILSAFVVTPGVEYLEASLEIIQYLTDGLRNNIHVITDTSGRVRSAKVSNVTLVSTLVLCNM